MTKFQRHMRRSIVRARKTSNSNLKCFLMQFLCSFIGKNANFIFFNKCVKCLPVSYVSFRFQVYKNNLGGKKNFLSVFFHFPKNIFSRSRYFCANCEKIRMGKNKKRMLLLRLRHKSFFPTT